MATVQCTTARALTWDEIVVLLNAMPKDKQPQLNKIFNDASNVLMSLVTTCIKTTKDEEDIVELERLKRIMKACPPDEMFIRIKDKIWTVREHLLTGNAKYFLEKDYSSLIKKDGNQSFIESLMEIIKTLYLVASDAEKRVYFQKAKILVELVDQFRILVGDTGSQNLPQ